MQDRRSAAAAPAPTAFRKAACWLGTIFLGLLLLPVLLWQEENWRGAREWHQAQDRLAAAHETLDLQKLLPIPISAEQNAAAAPIFSELFAPDGAESRLGSLKIWGKDRAKTPKFKPLLNEGRTDWPAWQAALTDQKNPATAEQDVLRFLQSKEEVMRDLREALARPAAVWPVTGPSLVTMKIPQVTAGLNAVQFLTLRAFAEIDLQQSDRAFDDLLLMLRLSDAIGEGRFLIAYLTSGAMESLAFAVLRQGIEKNAWSDVQIAEVEKILQARDPFGQAREALRLERASGLQLTTFSTGYFDAMADSEQDGSTAKTIAAGYQRMPQGWLEADRACIAETLQDAIETLDPATHAINFEKIRDVERGIAKTKPPRAIHFDPRRFFSRLVLPAMDDIPPKAAQLQAHLNEAILACAIELFRRGNDHLPETLDELKPRFLEAIPGDPIGGPMRYRRTPDGRDYILYSVGWDRKDDNGEVDAKHFKAGDWSWASRADLYRLAPN